MRSKRLWMLAQLTARKYSADNCSQMAAAISYYVLFSIVPLAIVFASVFGIVSRNADVRDEVVDRVVDQTALGGDEGEEFVADTVRGVSRVSAALSVLGLAATAWSASAMAGAVRRSLNVIWGVTAPRPLVQQKLIDLAVILGLGLLLAASVAATGALQALRRVGPFAESSVIWTAPSFVLPAALTFVAFVGVYRYLPAKREALRAVWPGALLATVLFEILKNGFAIYVAYFNNFDVVYGSLGAIMLFLLWTYFASSILLLGGVLAVEYTRLPAVAYSAQPPGPRRSLSQQVGRYVRGLFVSQRD